ncbi:MAG: hypothetical protein DI556_08490 [Rhodovulum sulfidophilum]|uniref:Crp/Fnr family transcriptional regulator n=1 Tax=Rhodovulum sulfidophilum TaxID=35806 RepID=A0A2W5NCY1_RHOSU|nr:MAG: hypothetical protein DI556_08490 [Rhodovulum sulfidophilum]
MTSSRSDDLGILARFGWLSGMPAAFRETVLDRCLLRRYRRDEVVYRAGDPPGGLYGLIRGGVGVELYSDDREPYIGTFARPGFWIGEGSVLTRGPRFIGIRATRDSLLAYLPLARWDQIVRSDPEAWRWLAHLSLRNSLLAVAVADALMVPGAVPRMAAILLVLSGPGAPGGPAAEAPIEMSQDDLARMANLSRSSAGRILQMFESDGLIAIGYRRIRVLAPEGLRRRRAGASAPAGRTQRDAPRTGEP